MDKDKVLSVPLWLLEKNYERKDSYFYYLRILEVLKINFDLEGYWKTGDKVAIVDVDGCRGVIPEGEFSSSGSLTDKVQGISRRGYLLDFVSIQYEDGQTDTIAVFSTKKYEDQVRAKKIKELESAGEVLAEVIGVTNFSVILLWNKLKLTLTKSEFLGSSNDIELKLFLTVGDKIPVIFKRVKKNGRVVEVTTKIKPEVPIYNKVVEKDTIKPEDLVTGVVVDRDVNSVYVKVGVFVAPEVTNRSEIVIKCWHPHESIDSLLIEGQVVGVKVKKIKYSIRRSGGLGSIITVDPHFTDDSIFRFREDLEQRLTELELEEKGVEE